MEDLEELRTENEKNISLFPNENIEELLEMDLEERRRRNIERNRRMFEQLFQSFTQTSQENEEELVQLTQAATDQANNSIEDEAQNLLTLEKKFTTCNNQIRLISHYLDRPKDTSLILSGLWPNQEKRQLVQAVCSIKSVHPIHMNLSEVSSLVDFIRLTTGRLLDTIDIYLSTGKKKSQRYHNALSHCRSIEHLIELLKEIHQELHNTPLSAEQPSNSSKSQLPSVPRNKIVFIFENYHTHELLGIASPPTMRLYEDLSLFTKSRFGVILLTESMNITHYSYKEITVHFPNYTDDEMKQIAIQRLTSLLEETHNQQPITTLNDIAIRLKGHILKVFGKILEVIPLIGGYGIHSFDKIYSIVILLLQKILQLRSLTSIVQLCIRSQGQSERESDEITAVLNTPIPTMTQLRPLLHQIINPPTYDMTCPADRNMESYENLPRRIRYLILAAFLAHINPKGTDNLKFIGEMTKKRKLSSAISGSAAAEEEKETVAAQRQQDTSRLFSLERLLSIYAQLIFMSEKKSMDVTSMKPLYGKVVGFIEVLVNRKLLWRPVPFNLHRPMYGANIPKTIAENVARSMNIALTDFIYDQNQFSSQWL